MTLRIEKLTKKQEAMLPTIAEEWIEIGLSCEPLDLPRAKQAVAKAYAAAHLDEPSNYFVFDSPFSAIGAAKKGGFF